MTDSRMFPREFVHYEYKEIAIPMDQLSMMIDCYGNFGWTVDQNIPLSKGIYHTTLRLKRDTKIANKTELTPLERHFEACIQEMDALEKSKSRAATGRAIVMGMLGTAFIAGSTFAVTAEPPHILLCAMLAIPGFIGWIAPCFLHSFWRRRREAQIEPFVEEKEEELFEVCQKGHALLE